MMMRQRLLAALILAAVVTTMGLAGEPVTLREDLSSYHRAVSTKSPEAQQYFDQGLTLYWGYNHVAAIQSFKRAQELDPKCAMAYWGEAISLGPNINVPMYLEDEQAKGAYDALQMAKRLSKKASPVERALIHALEARYTYPKPDDLMPLNIAYANAMRLVWREYPTDPDVGALYADAMMNLRPWDLWKPTGEPQPGTPEIMATIEKVFEMVPDHPGACHFYIHTCEASPFPQVALPAADRLRNRIPGAGHLVHMPAHIDVRLGHYEESNKANRRAIEIDNEWTKGIQGVYTVYRAHNYHFLAWGAMFEGQQEAAMTAARDVTSEIPAEMVRALPDFLEAFMAIPTHVLVRFGQWEKLLDEPRPPEDYLCTTAMWHYGRTVALAALNRVPEAEQELALFKQACEAVPESRIMGRNTVREILQIGLPMAEGEVEYRKGNHEKAFALLRTAVERDDALHYDEPWGWMMPTRHALGALLLEQGRYADAELVYRDDLRQHPNNGWALKGLSDVLLATNRTEEAEATQEQFAAAWERSDITIKTSCFCSRGMAAEMSAQAKK